MSSGSVRVPVRPRIVRRGSDLPRLLEEEVADLLHRGKPIEVFLCGRIGLGKSTALAHLDAVFPEDAGLRLCDGKKVLRDGSGPVTVSTTRSDPSSGMTFWLQSWASDDVIDYLLAKHPDDVGRIVAKWQSDTSHDLLDWPGACTEVLEALAADATISGPRSALTVVLSKRLGKHYEHAGDWAVRTSSSMRLASAPYEDSERHHLLGCSTARGVLAADRILRVAIQQPRHVATYGKWDAELRRSIVHTLQMDRNLREQLLALVAQPRVRHKAIVYGALALHEVGYRPPRAFRGSMSHAWLASVDLHEHHIRADLQHAVLHNANLRNAKFHDCQLTGVNLRGADASHATFDRVRAVQLGAVRIQAADSSWRYANLSLSDFRNANLSNADLTSSQLNGARFRGAVLCNASLANAKLCRTDLSYADLTGAQLTAANLEHIDLRNAHLLGTQLRFTDLRHCNLEALVLPNLVARGAKFYGCDLSDAVWTNADLRGATFAKCGLSGVDWQDSDLRGANLHRATFHAGNSRSGLIDSPIAGEGSRTGFYTDESCEEQFQAPEDIRKANLRNCDLRTAKVIGTDLYLVDLRGAKLDPEQRRWAEKCRAILDRPATQTRGNAE